MENKVPKLSRNEEIKLQTLMECFFKQFWAFAEFINDSNGQVETCKYADYVLYAFTQELREKFPGKLTPWSSDETSL